MNRISQEHLRRLRNDIPIVDLINYLNLPSKFREGYLRFLCPSCSEFNTATNPKTNLARCFRCRQNFNAIELVMAVQHCPFLHAVSFLDALLKNQSSQPVPALSADNDLKIALAKLIQKVGI